MKAGKLGSWEAGKLGSQKAGKQKKLIGHRLKAWKPGSLEAGKLGAESMEHGAERKKLIADR